MSAIANQNFTLDSIAPGSVTIKLKDSFHPNDVKSTFGFHTSNTYPERNRTVSYATEGLSDIRERASPEDKFTQAAEKAQTRFEEALNAIVINVMNILGYNPLLGLIPCIAQLIIPVLDKSSAAHFEPTEIKVAGYVRGAFQVLD